MPHLKPQDLLGRLSLGELLFSSDHRVIAIKTILTSLVMLALAGLFALAFRTELAAPGIQFLGARPYLGLLTLHGMIMVFGFLIPIVLGICYYLLPDSLKTGRLHWAGTAQASYWTLALAALLLIIGRPDFTWTVYAPMSLRVGGELVWMGYVAVALVGISEFLAGLVLLRNVFAWKGRWSELPLMGWGMVSEAALLLFSTPLLFLVGLFLLTDWLGATALFDPVRGGSTTTFLWMFWFYGHPAVYLPLVPAIAVLYTLLPRFLGRPMWSYGSGVVAFLLLVVLSFIVFHHHFQPDVTKHSWVQRAFQILTLLIFIPSTLHVFNWIATLWQDRIPASARAALPFKFMMGSIFFLILGGVTGYLNAQISVDSEFIHNTYWVPAHFHAMFLGFVGQMAVAGIYYLYPYFTGRMVSERLGNAHFWLWQLGIFAKVMLMYALGYAYFPRWVVDYLPLAEWTGAQWWLTVAAYLIGLGFILFIVNLALSARSGARAPDDPWAVADVETDFGRAAAPAAKQEGRAMVLRVWLVGGFLVVVAAWLLMVPWSPPPNQEVPGSMIDGYRASGLMPAAGKLEMSREIGHDVFELPAADSAEAGHGGGEEAGLSILAEGAPEEVRKALGAMAIDRTIEISMLEWGFRPGMMTVKPGEVIRLAVRHAGHTPHEFMIMTDAAMNAVNYRLERADWSLLEHEAIFEKPIVLPGDRFEVVLKVNQPGVWMFMCMLPYHMQLGMMGMLMTPGVSVDMSSMGHGGRPAASGPFEGKGTVVAVVPESREIVLDHEAIEGLMDAMTMGYPVASEALLQGLNPGDAVKFRIDPAGPKIVAIERLNQ